MSQILVSYSTILRASGAAAAQALVQCLHSQWFHWRRGGGGPEPARKREKGGLWSPSGRTPQKGWWRLLDNQIVRLQPSTHKFHHITVLVSSISPHFFVAPWPLPLTHHQVLSLLSCNVHWPGALLIEWVSLLLFLCQDLLADGSDLDARWGRCAFEMASYRRWTTWDIYIYHGISACPICNMYTLDQNPLRWICWD